MKTRITLIIAAALLVSCSQKEFMGLDVTPQEKESLEFLYKYMPMADRTDYPPQFHLDNVRASIRAREEMGWNVPEREWKHFVLPLRVNNENLDSHRSVFYEELKPRVEGLSMKEAILEVNHWCHEKVTYQPSDARTSSPLNTVKNALGRCGEESTFTVAALRSIGIPARQVYTPRWAHTDDNHAWVEAWADGQWWFMGACEPEPVLNLGWFNSPASRALLMHTRAFGKYDGPEEVVLRTDYFTEINLIGNYAQTARCDFRILRADGSPAKGARVDFCIYNYAEFYPAVTKYADRKGRTFLSAGMGDMLVWASLNGEYGYSKVSFGKDTEVTVTLGSVPEKDFMTIVPPPETANIPEVTARQREENNIRFAREDSLRHAYEATFPKDGPEYVVKARGNWQTIQTLLDGAPDAGKAEAVLASLSTKDLHDITPEILLNYYKAEPFLGARVENEFLTPFYGQIETGAGSPEELVRWVRENIKVVPSALRIPQSPTSVLETRVTDSRSRDIFFVDAARAAGFPARKDPVTGKVQYLSGENWLDVDFDGAPAAEAPKGTLRLSYVQSGAIDNPKYYSHFTISRIDGGRTHLLAFDEGEVDMGGGVDWANTFKDGTSVDAGEYLLVSGNRLSSGSVPVTLRRFTVEEGSVAEIPLIIEEPKGAVSVIGSFDSETGIMVDGKATSILAVTGRGNFVIAMLEPGKEPTNHVLRDIAAARFELEDIGTPIVLLCPSESALRRVEKEAAEGRYGKLPANVTMGIADPALFEGERPVVIVADTFNRVYYRSEGYTIGLGDRLAGLLSRL